MKGGGRGGVTAPQTRHRWGMTTHHPWTRTRTRARTRTDGAKGAELAGHLPLDLLAQRRLVHGDGGRGRGRRDGDGRGRRGQRGGHHGCCVCLTERECKCVRAADVA